MSVRESRLWRVCNPRKRNVSNSKELYVIKPKLHTPTAIPYTLTRDYIPSFWAWIKIRQASKRSLSYFLEQVTRVRVFPRKITAFAITNCSANFAKNDYQSFFIRKIPPWSSTLPHYLCQNKSRTHKASYFYFGAGD